MLQPAAKCSTGEGSQLGLRFVVYGVVHCVIPDVLHGVVHSVWPRSIGHIGGIHR